MKIFIKMEIADLQKLASWNLMRRRLRSTARGRRWIIGLEILARFKLREVANNCIVFVKVKLKTPEN
jgi:hypothetical protein